MKHINLEEAQINFFHLIELVNRGEKVIIYNAGKPVAELIAFKPKVKAHQQVRLSGALVGQITMIDDSDLLPEEWIEHFE